MNKTMKRNVVVSALLAIMLCVSLIVGATYALFTSESKVNVSVTSGNVDVVATVENLKLDSTLAKGNLSETSATESKNVITLDKIVPGDYVTFDIRIHNNSNVAVQYRTIITKVSDEGLWNGLVVTFDDVAFVGTNDVKTDWKDMAVGSADIIVSVKVALPETAGNEYKNTSCSFAYTVEAVQGNAEITQEWDGTTTTEVSKNTEDGKYHITTASEFAWVMAYNSGLATNFVGWEIVLDCNIDFGGATITGVGGATPFAGIFDGQGHTISNFVIDSSSREYYAGLFPYLYGATVKNVNVSGATVIGQKQVGVLVGAASDNSTVTNCNVYDSTVIATKKVGAVVGYTLNSTVTNCHAENCNVYCAENDANECGEVIGFENIGTTATDNTSENVTVLTGYSAITNATELRAALENGGNYVLANDIDMKNVQWDALTVSKAVVLDGNDHTISNLYVRHYNNEQNGVQYGFGFISNAKANVTIKNLTFTGADVGPEQSQIDAEKGNIGGVVMGYSYATTVLENVIVENSKVSGYGKLGCLIGYASSGSVTLTNCISKNNTIVGGSNLGGLIGTVDANVAITTNSCKVENITFTKVRESESLYILASNITVTTEETNFEDFMLVKGGTFVLNGNGYYYGYTAQFYTKITGNCGSVAIDGTTYQFCEEIAVNE